jgi:16S rRNA processing protein RimM
MNRQQSSRNNDELNSTGSPQQGEPLYLVVGQIKKAHGLKGEVLFEIKTDFPERLRKGKRVYVGDQHTEETIASTRFHNKGLLIRFDGKEKPEDIESLRNELVYVRSDEIPPLPSGEYYFYQLTGLKVYNEQDGYRGDLTEIMETGANDVYLITTPDGNEVLVPAIDSVIKRIDLENRKMVISPPEWY